MSCLGGFRAVAEREIQRLRALPRKDRGVDYLDGGMVQEGGYDVDESWDAKNRALTGRPLGSGNSGGQGC